jgi:hypothetical protein
VNILTQQGNELKTIAQLPNESNSKVIGKVNAQGIVDEDIKAVRFYESNAYIVTFLETDPLYIIDLADNTKPVITGELEIPGYSSYLHPLSDNLLLGIGQNVDPNRFTTVADNTGSEQSSPVIEGAKVTLFDISDLQAPKEIKSIVYADGYTPVEYNYHALTYLPVADGTFRFALPVERWKIITMVEDGQKYDIWQASNSLELLEVTSSDSDAELVIKGSILAEQPENNLVPFIHGGDDRGVLHYDDIYYIHGNDVWRSYWLNPEQVEGPF